MGDSGRVARQRIPTWLAIVAFAFFLPFAIAVGVWEYVNATTTPLHKNAQEVKSVEESEALPKWAGAVQQGRQIARAGLVEQNLPGLSVAVGVSGEIVWAEGFGWSDIESEAAVTPKTRFRIGTASTALTSVALGLLMEKGQLKLDETIQTYVPEFSAKKWPVTVRQLMGHVAGVQNDGGDEGPLFSQHCKRPVEALQLFGEDSLRFEPGTEYRYSSYGWILLSAAVEAASREPFLSFMTKQVFEPLGMADTMADAATVDPETGEYKTPPTSGQSPSYFPRFGGDPRYGPDPMRALDYSCYAGSSVFVSTPSDMVRFTQAIGGVKLLQQKTVGLLQAPQRLPSGAETGYGLGWDLETATLSGKPASLVGHDGDVLGGMAVSFMTFPEHGIVVAVMSNTSYADTYGLAVKLAEAFAPAVQKAGQDAEK